ncbi:hypothetical protein I79_009971 [Cricetulus griseus]|uniref:Uncharacterized protein n=1 Tax=Cricetulus griseus TaxID=10029 RepID=G3HH74_CRIGR|nr:hypothetical protein I79_009971 [Cricetulus griseus]
MPFIPVLRFLSLRPAWSRGQPELYSETLSQNKKPVVEIPPEKHQKFTLKTPGLPHAFHPS